MEETTSRVMVRISQATAILFGSATLVLAEQTINIEQRIRAGRGADAHGVHACKGIPSVAPPVGKLRLGFRNRRKLKGETIRHAFLA